MNDLTPEQAGHRAIVEYRLGQHPLSTDEERQFQWPKCNLCRRRPTLMVRKGRWLIFITGLKEEPKLDIPRYDILPCCSGKYTKEVGLGKKQRLQLAEQVKARQHETDGHRRQPINQAPDPPGPAEPAGRGCMSQGGGHQDPGALEAELPREELGGRGAAGDL
jgi:hypothetical protein